MFHNASVQDVGLKIQNRIRKLWATRTDHFQQNDAILLRHIIARSYSMSDNVLSTRTQRQSSLSADGGSSPGSDHFTQMLKYNMWSVTVYGPCRGGWWESTDQWQLGHLSCLSFNFDFDLEDIQAWTIPMVILAKARDVQRRSSKLESVSTPVLRVLISDTLGP